MFNRFYKLDSKDKQDLFLQGLIHVSNVKTHRKRKENSQERTHSFTYYLLTKDGSKTKVCLKAFLSVLSVTKKRISRINHLSILGKSPKDMRGRNVSGNAFSEQVRLAMREHIQSFPIKESHYSGRPINYLDKNLNIKIMYKLFKEKYEVGKKVSYITYYNFFKENFKLSFGRPQIDVCATCERLNIKLRDSNLNINAKKVAEAELTVHKRRSNKFYAKLKSEATETASNSHILSICFDFMQNIQLPKTPVGDVFYYNELTVNVFCIHNVKKNTAAMYIYHEGIAKKSPDEVCSFLLDYITLNSDGITELHLYSDNCWGQNKNHALIRMLLCLTDLNRFKKIIQYFPIRGHSFLPCDRDFSMIKRKLKKQDRIFTVHQLTEIIANSSNTNKFLVKEVSSSEIFDFKTWWPKFYKKNVISRETRYEGRDKKYAFNISKFSQFVYDSEQVGRVVASEYIDGLQRHTFDLKQTGNFGKLQPTLPLVKAYPASKVPIKVKKIEGIKKCIQFVDEDFKVFYENIIKWPTTSNEIPDDDHI